ncbi:hypothetical protein ACFL6I_00640 [candidate division KSB1 bacterium]
MNTANENHNGEKIRIVLGNALDEVQKRVSVVLNRYKISYSTILNYLQANKPELLESICIVEDTIDTGILGKADEGNVSDNTSEEWKRSVRDWQYLIIEGVNSYEEFQEMSFVA